MSDKTELMEEMLDEVAGGVKRVKNKNNKNSTSSNYQKISGQENNKGTIVNTVGDDVKVVAVGTIGGKEKKDVTVNF